MNELPVALQVMSTLDEFWIECAVCGRREFIKPLVLDEWTWVVVLGFTYAICPGEVPPRYCRAEVRKAALRLCCARILEKLGVYN